VAKGFPSAQIRGPLAAWVLLAHAYALLLPALLVAVCLRYQDYLARVSDYPRLFYLAAAVFALASLFEVLQNTRDRWYLTPDCASANGIGLLDGLFYGCLTLGQGLVAVAIAGHSSGVVVLAIAATLAWPLTYLSGVAAFSPLSVVSLLAALLAWRAFGDPVVFLQFLLTAMTLYFFTLLLRTGQQALHGFTAVAASSGVLLLSLAIANGAAGRRVSWWALLLAVVVSLIAGRLLWTPLSRLQASPRLSIAEP
jgi:hypothetical protein